MPSFDTTALIHILEKTRSLSAHDELEPLLSAIVEMGISVLEADRGSIFLYSAETEELYTLVATGENEIRIPITSGIAGECARDKKIINVPDCHCDDRFNQEIDTLTGYTTRSMLSIPLVGLNDALIGVIQFINSQNSLFNENDENAAAIYANQAAVALQKTLLIDDRNAKLRMERDLEIARTIQEQMLPKQIPQPERYDIAAYSKPSDLTGGDIYDLHWCEEYQNEVLLLLADATGHGIGPALAATQLRSALRMGVHTVESLSTLVSMINNQLMEDLPDDKFITAFIGKLYLAENKIQYLSPGQAPLLKYCAESDQVIDLGPTSPPLGILTMDETEPKYIELQKGDIVVLLTDGFYEFENGENDMFGKEKVISLLQSNANRSAKTLLNTIVQSVRKFGGKTEQTDDMTAIVIKRVE